MSPRPPVAPYLTVSPAAGAIAFYTAAFDAKQKALMPAMDGLRILHCELEINGGALFLSDAFPEFGTARTPLPGEPRNHVGESRIRNGPNRWTRFLRAPPN
jgi:PhnB protein